MASYTHEEFELRQKHEDMWVSVNLYSSVKKLLSVLFLIINSLLWN